MDLGRSSQAVPVHIGVAGWAMTGACSPSDWQTVTLDKEMLILMLINYSVLGGAVYEIP